MPRQSLNLTPGVLNAPADDPPRATPPEGDWYVPQGADNARPIDYFKDDQPLIGRILALTALAIILAIAATLGIAWNALPLLEVREHHTPAVYDGPAPRKVLNAPAALPATRPAAISATTAPAAPVPTTQSASALPAH